MGTKKFFIPKKAHLDFMIGWISGFACGIVHRVHDSFWVFLSKLLIFVLELGFIRSPENYVKGEPLSENGNDDPSKEESSVFKKYEFLHGNGISGFLQVPEVQSFTVQEFFVEADEARGLREEGFSEGFVFEKISGEEENRRKQNLTGGRETEDLKNVLGKEYLNFTAGKRLKEQGAAADEKIKDSVSVETEESDLDEEQDLNFIVKNRLEKLEEEADEKNTEDSVSVEKNYFENFSFFVGKRLEKLEEETDEKADDAVSVETEEKDSEKEEIFNFIVEKRLEKLEEETNEKTDDTVSVETENKDSEKEENFKFIVEKRLEKLAVDPVSVQTEDDGDLAGSTGGEVSVVANTNTMKLEPESPKLIKEARSGDVEDEISVSSESPLNQEGNLMDDFDEEFIELEPQIGNLNWEAKDAGEDLDVLEDSQGSSPAEQIPKWDSGEEDEDGSGSGSDSDSDSDFDAEEDEILEQLKMDIRNARTGGLPTILEESESPKMVQEFKPLKFEEKLDHIAEINKVFKTYLDRMKKLDILNCQTMHAIGLLQLKGPDQSNVTKKSSALAIKNLWPFRQRKADGSDSRKKSIRDLQKDFETVYVGQICLSWEILNWQYNKALKLFEFDHQRIKQYNQVAGEFQLFQVLLQRFLEDEPFQTGSRVQSYVKNRFVLRKFIQVPSLKDDRLKDKSANRYVEEKNAISIEDFADIMEETMHMFWEFLRADKDEVNVSLKIPQITQVAPQGPVDSELLIEIQTDFQKKERKLKEILRSSSCIVKKFQKQRQQSRNLLNHTYLVAQAELKLVSRVLNMSKISAEQLVWCQEKLEKLKFYSRKIEIEPSCLLFPC